MSWTLIAQLLVQYGIPTVAAIIQKVESGQQATLADFQALIALESQQARDRMLAVLRAQNIEPTSPTGLALLAAVS
jgi:hypothetical protein